MTAFTHLDESGAARMVDVTAKQPTVREASASARVDVSPRVMGALRTGAVPKGDVLAVARIAGIGAATGARSGCPWRRTTSPSPRPCAPPTARASRWRPSPR